MSQQINPGGINAHLAPDAFRRWATHYYQCKQDFKCQNKFSPVPYFLLFRAIELEIKSRHLKYKQQLEVKYEYGHDLIKAYDALGKKGRILSSNEIGVLRYANEIYSSKGFEYFDPQDALTGYSRYPDLNHLDKIAKKFIGEDA